VAASCKSGHAVGGEGSRDRIRRRAATSRRPGRRRRGKSATPTTQADPASTRQWARLALARSGQVFKTPGQSCPFRGRVARQLVGGLVTPWRDWTCADAASGWPEASTVGYGWPVELQQRIADRIGEFLIFAVTPPRLATGPEQTRQIAEVTLARLRSVGIDGLVALRHR